MVSKERQKGTGEETATVRDWNADADAEIATRMPASAPYDIQIGRNAPDLRPLEVLTVRADRGERLAVIRHSDLRALVLDAREFAGWTVPVHEEVKRYARLAISQMFEKKFGR